LTEKELLADVRLALGSMAYCRVFRNNIGVGHQGRVLSRTSGQVVLGGARQVRYGLFPGSGDLIGWKSVVITPEMVGQRFAQFASVETKAERGAVREDQETWIRAVRSAGGLAGIARSVQDAVDLIG
jgi:hypothetical protein